MNDTSDRIERKIDLIMERQETHSVALGVQALKNANLEDAIVDIKSILKRHNKQLETALLPITVVKWLVGLAAGVGGLAGAIKAVAVMVGK